MEIISIHNRIKREKEREHVQNIGQILERFVCQYNKKRLTSCS